MANHSLRESITYRLSPDGRGTARQLASRFRYSPRNSMTALLAQAGPFWGTEPYRNAFRFRNRGGWNMTVAEAGVLRAKLQREVDVVKLIGIEALRSALLAVRIDVPLIPTFDLPGIVVSEVIRRVTGDLTNKIVDSILASSPSDYGRCGGMAFAGLDYFLAGRDVSEETSQPGDGPLRSFVWTRLLDSLDLNGRALVEWTMQYHILPVISRTASALIGAVAGTVVGGPVGAAIGAFMAGKEDILGLGGPKVLARYTRDHWNRLRVRLDQGPAWPIGVIYSSGAFPWDQHQVLALRYQDMGGGNIQLVVWDNNDGRSERIWAFNPGGEELVVTQTNVSGAKAVKGIICEEYTFRVPPRG